MKYPKFFIHYRGKAIGPAPPLFLSAFLAVISLVISVILIILSVRN